MELHINNIGEYLKNNGIKPSYQRIKIFQYIEENQNHPTVDMIYKALCSEIPTLSKTTVYNTLNLFIEKNIVNMLVIEENETRYDSVMEVHGHFKCEKCGKIFDVKLNDDVVENKDLKDFEIKEQHFYFKGYCKECANKIEEERIEKIKN